MKYLILVLTIFNCHLLMAEPARQKSAMEDIVEAMAQSYLQSATQELAVKTLNDLAVQSLGESVDGKLGSALAIYSIYQNLNAYNSANLESQKYQAAAHMTATAMTMIAPPVGVIVQGVVFFQDLAATYIFSSHKVELAKLQAEAVRLHRERSDIITAQFNREIASFKFLLASEASIRELINVQKSILQEVCAKIDQDQPQSLKNCIQESLLLLNLMRLQERTIQLIVGFNGRMFQVSLLNRDEGSQTVVNEMKNGLISLRKQITDGRRNIQSALEILSEARVADIERKQELNRAALTCEGRLLKAQSRDAILRVKQEKGQVLSFLEEVELEEVQVYIERSKEKECASP